MDGAPAIRIWKIGTRRMLGVYSGPEAERNDPLDNEHPELPENVKRAFKPFQNQVFADFEVCPIRQKKPDRVQAVCVESAKKVVVQQY